MDRFMTGGVHHSSAHATIADFVSLMEAFARVCSNLFFVEIGACDGVVSDPIYEFVKKHHWRGIAVEPQREVFERQLRANYSGIGGVVLENKAVATETGARELYTISFSSSRWATGLASFRRSSLQELIDNGYVDECARKEGILPPPSKADYIGKMTVETISLRDLLERHRVEKIDLLQIDAEGYDFEIIKTVDFARVKPVVIHYEHVHLLPNERQECRSLLMQNGYSIMEETENTVAFLRRFFKGHAFGVPVSAGRSVTGRTFFAALSRAFRSR